MILIKYKPAYKVIISGQEIGYIKSIKAFEKDFNENIVEEKTNNVDSIEVKTKPEYELKLIDRTLETNEDKIAEELKKDTTITYKYYEIAYNDESIKSVDTIEEAEQVISALKKENEQELNLNIVEKYTTNQENIKTEKDIELAKTEIKETVEEKIKQDEKEKAEEERINSLPEINGIKIAAVPVAGTITSRYGESSRIRSSTHTGLDISAKTGTEISAVAAGTVTCASYQGSYGKLVKIDHGNGVETWYAHTSKIYVQVGQKVEAGEKIAAVGSTGNSTGPHLHLEIRVNGQHINPQQYLFRD